MRVFLNGLITGLTLQLAIGSVFFFIVNLSLQKSFLDGMAGVLAVTLVDLIYISLAILGVGSLLEHKRVRKPFGMLSALVLIFFGIWFIAQAGADPSITAQNGQNLFSSFGSVFALTITNPMTIVFFTSLFSAKALSFNYTKHELGIFGLSVALATFLFMGGSVVFFSLIKQTIPLSFVTLLNIGIGLLIIGYGLGRIRTSVRI